MDLVLVQLEILPGRPDRNLERAVEAIRNAAGQGIDLVALPELFNVGYFAFESYDREAEPLDGPTLSRLQSLAVELDVAILAGSIVENLGASADSGFETPATSGLSNTSVLFDSEGNRRLIYRKRHLFGYESAEQDLLTPGERLQTADLFDFTVGVTTCYDLRFPELYRQLVDRGVTLTLVPSAWPYPRVEHWQLLPRARAIENLMYVAAVNGVGSFDDASLLGRSSVYDPWGTKLAGAGTESAQVSATLDPERVRERRNEFPVLGDRR